MYVYVSQTKLSYPFIHHEYSLSMLSRPTSEETREELRSNYERYRAVILNGFHGVSEQDALAKIDVEEMYPAKKKGIGKEKHK